MFTFGVIFFFLTHEAITIAVVNCKTSLMCELSVTCNALWKRFKMVDDRQSVLFLKFRIYTQAETKKILC